MAGAVGPGSLPNDIVYVPRHRADISIDANGSTAGVGTTGQQDSVYAVLDALVQGQQCLREQRGRIMARNSCRNGWLSSLNARLTTTVPVAGGQHLEITADRWGRYFDTTIGPSVRMLTLRGSDTANGRGIYQFALPQRGVPDVVASRWRIQLGARYGF